MKSGQQPLYYNHMSSGRPCVWGWGWRSCYRDASDQGLYPFGHGLTYSSILDLGHVFLCVFKGAIGVKRWISLVIDWLISGVRSAGCPFFETT